MTDIRKCDSHGYFTADECPECGSSGTHVLSSSKRKTLSKFVSGALRHFPDDAGIDLDGHGWTDAYALADVVQQKYDWVEGADTLVAVISADAKGRFEVDGDRVRAAYGHSVDVDLDAVDEVQLPETLYHGTPSKNVESILDEGLKPMNRQEVHLSDGVSDAQAVGERHADDPVILEIDARQMEVDGLDVAKRGNATYTAEHVPAEYIERQSSE